MSGCGGWTERGRRGRGRPISELSFPARGGPARRDFWVWRPEVGVEASAIRDPQMNAASNAVFLSYASQDAGVARQICDALRAAGLEVWFDQSELRGGDAWDQKIRNQIKECALFVPVISANTQSRPEGYFRLEWKLAVDRSHLMADDQPFIVPVVVDDTPEPAARVPEKFREVQWTRLVLTETPAAFATRLRMLLSGAESGGGNVPQNEMSREQRRAERATRRSSGWRWWMLFPIAGMLFALAGALRPYFPFDRSGGEKTEKRASSPTPVASEVGQLMAKAKALYEPWDGASSADFALAEELLKRATVLDPTDGEVWAAYGIVMCGNIVFNHHRQAGRFELARTTTERAVRLAPDSIQARFAQAFYFRFQDATIAEAEKVLRELVERAPTDKLILRTLGALLRNKGSYDEAISWFDRAAALPGGDPVALYNKSMCLWNDHRYAESEGVIDQALEKHPTSYLYRAKVRALLALRGNLDEAVKVLQKVPPSYLLEDAAIFWASQLWLWRREPEKCLSVVHGVSRDIIENDFGGPRAFLAGLAHEIAGRPEAAKTEWRAALQVIEREMAAQSNLPRWHLWKGRLLAHLGRLDEAEQALRTFEQLSGLKTVNDFTIPVYLLLNRRDEVLAALETWSRILIKSGNAGRIAIMRNAMRYDPVWDPIRDNPRFKAIEQEMAEKK
jgi:tetratricopeptide (TPR) repeat protein